MVKIIPISVDHIKFVTDNSAIGECLLKTGDTPPDSPPPQASSPIPLKDMKDLKDFKVKLKIPKDINHPLNPH